MKVIKFSKVYLFITIALSIMYIVLLAYNMGQTKENRSGYLISILLFILAETTTIILYIFVKKYKTISKEFSNIIIIAMTIFALELNIVLKSNSFCMECWTIVAPLFSFLSTFSSQKRCLIFVLVVCQIYSMIRLGFWYRSKA